MTVVSLRAKRELQKNFAITPPKEESYALPSALAGGQRVNLYKALAKSSMFRIKIDLKNLLG